MVSQDKTFQQHMNLTLGITASSICPSKPESPAYTMPAAKSQIQHLLPVKIRPSPAVARAGLMPSWNK